MDDDWGYPILGNLQLTLCLGGKMFSECLSMFLEPVHVQKRSHPKTPSRQGT